VGEFCETDAAKAAVDVQDEFFKMAGGYARHFL